MIDDQSPGIAARHLDSESEPARPISRTDSRVPDRDPHRVPDPSELTALSSSEALFRSLIENNADGIMVVDRHGSVCYVNPMTCLLLGRSRDELLGSTFGVPLAPEESTEIELPRSGQPVRIAELRVAEIPWRDQSAYLVSLRDVTERHHQQEQLRRTSRALAEADRRKDQFLAMLAHELRNPLGAIDAAVQLLHNHRQDPGLIDHNLGVMDRQVQILVRLIDDLMDVSRITRGEIELRIRSIDLHELMDRAIETVRPLIEQRRHTFHVGYPERPLRLMADPVRMTQVLANLLHNAAKYTEPGGRIELQAERVDQPGSSESEVLIRVLDSGIGIESTNLDSIFELFVQADQGLDRPLGGLGIGLTQVQRLVELHSGTVEAFSDGPGFGSEFRIRLPLTHDYEQPNSDAFSTLTTDPQRNGHAWSGRLNQIPGVSTSRSTTGASGLRLLIADDNTDAARLIGMILESRGTFDVRIVHDGCAALETVYAFLPEVIVLDIGLPGMDGFAIAERVRYSEAIGELPPPRRRIVAVSGYGCPASKQRGRDAGFDDHLVKPVDPEALFARIVQPADGPGGTGTC